MNSREILAVLYSEKWAFYAARTDETPDAVRLCQHYHQKAVYWAGLGGEAEASPKKSTETPVF